MSLKIGFPIVHEDGKCDAVWIETTRRGPNPFRVKWNGKELRTQSPFGDSAQLNKTIEKVLNYQSISFTCDHQSLVSGDGRDGYFVEKITGTSYGLALYIAIHYIIPSASDDLCILLTGGVEPTSRHPQPLGEKTIKELEIKEKYADENGYGLVLLQQDYKCLHPKKRGKVLPGSFNELKEHLSNRKEDGSGFTYILPVSSLGEWEGRSGEDWLDILAGQVFDLERLVPDRSPSTDNDEEFEETTDTPNNETNTTGTVSAISGTIGKLYEAALPTKLEYSRAFSKENDSLCRKNLFPEGILATALTQQDRLFYNRRDFYDGKKFDFPHILIGGPTGCGKTFLAEAIILNSILEHRQGVVIYVAPTRSLVYERHEELVKRFCIPGFIEGEDIVRSTGEFWEHDAKIRKGNFQIALLVYEKANLFLEANFDLLRKVELVVIDELHMLTNETRGGVVDMLLAKLIRQHGRRKREDEIPLRIVAISTEELIRDEKIKKVFTKYGPNKVNIDPVVVSTTQRPVPVQHHVVIYGYDSKHLKASAPATNITVPIVKFSNEDDRNLGHKLEDIQHKFRDQQNKLKTLAISTPDQEETALVELIRCYSKKEYKKLLVACPSVQGLTKLAQTIKNKRSDQEKTNKELEKLVYSGLVTREEGKELLTLARRCIFVHHAQLPLKIREWVETHFKKNEDNPSSISEILFTTETLFYGVNLPADCVILTDLQWTREDVETGIIEKKPLTPNEYHNVLGRAGRPGYNYGETIPVAVVCFSTKDFDVHHDVGDKILKYYENNSPKDFSSVLLRSDIRNAEREIIEKLDDVTYPTFRSVMDALRHLGVSKTGEDKKSVSLTKMVNDLFNDTIFFGVLEQRELDKEVAKKLIQRVLEVAVDYSGENFSLVKRTSPNEYRITPQAEALIDTGTNWRDISPMLGWLKKLDELKGAVLTLPVELLVPAFISSHKLWTQAKQFCKEDKQSTREPSPEKVADNEDKVKRLLLAELKELPGINSHQETAEAIEKRLSEYVAKLDLSTPVSDYKKAIFYRLVTAFLKWLRGVELEEIQELSVMTDDQSDKQRFQNRYAEKASWLSVMCLRFFADSSLQSRHTKELPQFSLRLRYGISSEGLPFSENISAKKDYLNRVQIQELVDNQITAATLIKGSSPISKITENEQLSPELRDKAETIVGRVFWFYQKQVAELKGEISNELETQWNEFEKLFRRFVGKGQRDKKTGGIRATESEHIESLRSIMVEVLKMRGKLQVSLAKDNLSIKVGDDKLLFIILAPSDSPKTKVGDRDYPMIIRLPWGNDKSPLTPYMELTACGGMVLAVLLGREFLTPKQFMNRMKKRTGTKILSIKDIVEEFDADMSDLPGTLREALLKFNEPGI